MRNKRKRLSSILVFMHLCLALNTACCPIGGGKKVECSSTVLLAEISEYRANGFTCTGMCFDSINHVFYIGNIGILTPEDADNMKSTIVVLSENILTVQREIILYELYPNMKDIQGVAYDGKDNTLWFCSFGENKIYHIYPSGEYIGSYDIKNPTGIAIDPTRNNVWVLTYTQLIQLSKNGIVQQIFDIEIEGQDQLCYDSSKDRLLMTVGLNYNGTNFVYEINPQNGKYEIKYNLLDSYAVEGIALYKGQMYIANDGLYHNAKSPRNQINIYEYK